MNADQVLLDLALYVFTGLFGFVVAIAAGLFFEGLIPRIRL